MSIAKQSVGLQSRENLGKLPETALSGTNDPRDTNKSLFPTNLIRIKMLSLINNSTQKSKLKLYRKANGTSI